MGPKPKLHQHCMSWSRQCLVLLKLLFLRDFFQEYLFTVNTFMFSKRMAVQTQQAFSSTPEHPAQGRCLCQGADGTHSRQPLLPYSGSVSSYKSPAACQGRRPWRARGVPQDVQKDLCLCAQRQVWSLLDLPLPGLFLAFKNI